MNIQELRKELSYTSHKLEDARIMKDNKPFPLESLISSNEELDMDGVALIFPDYVFIYDSYYDCEEGFMEWLSSTKI